MGSKSTKKIFDIIGKLRRIFSGLILTLWSSMGQMTSFVTWFRCKLGHPRVHGTELTPIGDFMKNILTTGVVAGHWHVKMSIFFSSLYDLRGSTQVFRIFHNFDPATHPIINVKSCKQLIRGITQSSAKYVMLLYFIIASWPNNLALT